MQLGSLPGLVHERTGQGPSVLPGLSPAALLLPLGRVYAWLAADPPALVASCLKRKGAPPSTDSCSVAPEPRRVWASGRPVGAEPGIYKVNIRTEPWAWSITPISGMAEPETTQLLAQQ